MPNAQTRTLALIALIGAFFGALIALRPDSLLGLLALAVLAFVFLEPEKGLFLAIFYMNFEGIAKRASPTALPYLFKDLLFIAILLGAIYRYRKKGLSMGRVPHSSLVILFALVVLLQVFNPLNELSFIGKLSGARFFLLYFPAYFAGFMLINEKPLLKKLSVFIIAMSVLVTAIGVAGYYIGWGETAVGEGTLFQTETAKLSSTLSDSPSFSYTLAFVSILLFAMVFTNNVLSPAALVAFPLFAAGMLLSLDRIAWVAFFAGLFMISYFKKKKMFLLGAVIFGLMVLPFAADMELAGRVVSLTDPIGTHSMQVRIGNAMLIFKDPTAWVFGRGLQIKGGAFLEEEGFYYPGAEFNYIGMIYQLGLLGFIVFIALIYNIAKTIRQNIGKCSDKFLKTMGIVAFAQVIAAMMMFGGGGFFYWMPIGFYTWLLIGAAAKLNQIKTGPSS